MSEAAKLVHRLAVEKADEMVVLLVVLKAVWKAY